MRNKFIFEIFLNDKNVWSREYGGFSVLVINYLFLFMILLHVFLAFRVLRGHSGYSGKHCAVYAFQIKSCLLLCTLPGCNLVFVGLHASIFLVLTHNFIDFTIVL